MLGDAIADVLPELQAQAESMMTLTLEAAAPGIVTDSENYKVPGLVPKGRTIGRVTGSSAASRDPVVRNVVIGGVERPVLEGGLHLPISAFVTDGQLEIVAGDQTVGWVFTVVDVGPRDDASLLNRKFLVVSVPAKSYATARRLDIAEV